MISDTVIVTTASTMTAIITTGVIIIKFFKPSKSKEENKDEIKDKKENNTNMRELINQKITERLKQWKEDFCTPAHQRFDKDKKNLGILIKESEERTNTRIKEIKEDLKTDIKEIKEDLTERIESMETNIIAAVGKR